jgi:Cd2+/Zn2+-exporting ATPase
MARYGIAVSADTDGTLVWVAVDGKRLGAIRISDTLKEDAKEAVKALKDRGIAVAMLTGDTEASAKAVAAETGIDEVYARLLPEEKLNNLVSLRKKYGPVMFVGDGINDAPVLSGADVGAAMGSGADAAIEAADVVFMTSKVSAIAESVGIAKQTQRIAWQNVVFALAVKAAVMVLGLLGGASMWAAVFADSGVAMLCVLNSIRLLYRKK